MAGCHQKIAPFREGPYAQVAVGPYRLLVSQTEAQIEQGLMGVPGIPKDQGMLFVRGNSAPPATFWMKHCLTDMDMVFIGGDGCIQNIEPARVPAPGASDRDLIIYTAKGPMGIREALHATGLPATPFVVELAPGEGARFASMWTPSMRSSLSGEGHSPASWGF